MNITIDCTPYDVRVNDQHSVDVLDCEGSILGKLVKPANKCWSANTHTLYNDKVIFITMDAGTCSFECREGVDVDEVSEWIAENFDAIDSIGYEVLYDE